MNEDTYQLADSAYISTTLEDGDTVDIHLAVATDDKTLIERLCAGDEATFTALLDQYSPSMIRLAMIYVTNRTIAEEVVQDTWLAVLQGLNRFEGRSSLKTWIFRILMNIAKTRCQREGRSIPFSSLSNTETEAGEPTVAPGRFHPPGTPYEGSLGIISS